GDRVPGMAGVLRLPHTAADGAEIKGVGLAGVAGHGETASAAHGAHVAPAQTRQQTGRILTRGAHLLGEDRQAQPGQQAQRGEKDKPAASTYHVAPRRPGRMPAEKSLYHWTRADRNPEGASYRRRRFISPHGTGRAFRRRRGSYRRRPRPRVTHPGNRIGSPASSSTPQACGRFGEGTRRYHPRRRRAAWVGDFVRGMWIGLSCRGGTLEFVAEVLKVFRADLQLQHFFDHR